MYKNLVYINFKMYEVYFKYFDVDGNGSIDSSEFSELHADLMKHGYGLPDDPAKCLRVLDANGDGEVELEEFLDWMVGAGHV